MEKFVVVAQAGATFAPGSVLALDGEQVARRAYCLEPAETEEAPPEGLAACRVTRPTMFKLGETVTLIAGPEANKRLLEVVMPEESAAAAEARGKAEAKRDEGRRKSKAAAEKGAAEAQARQARKTAGAPGAKKAKAANKKAMAETPKRSSKVAPGEGADRTLDV